MRTEPLKSYERTRCQIEFPEGEGRTDQSQAEACDINNLMKRFETTGELPPMAEKTASYGDFSGVTDYHDSLLQINQALDSFMDLPAKIRLEFDNDPAKLIAFMGDPENLDKGIEMGLYGPKAPNLEPSPVKPPEATPEPSQEPETAPSS